MTLKQWLTMAVVTSLSFAAHAQQVHQQPDPLDANAAVSATTYVSAFKDYCPLSDQQASPDKVWRATNDEMARLGGHAGHSKLDVPASQAPVQSAPVDHGKHH